MDATPQSGPNWNLLRTFHAIAAEQSITKAARRLGVSQPSVSTALQKLEAQLKCQLVFRDSRRFALTQQGGQIYHECREMFRGAERIAQAVRGASGGESGEVRYQIISNLASPMLDEILRLYHQRHPSVTFQSEVKNSQTIVQSVRQGRTNIGICLLVQPPAGLCAIRLFREEFRLFCGAEHPLFGRASVSVEDVEREPFISFACATEGAGLEPMSILRAGMRLGSHIAGLSTNMEEVRRMIAAGLGIGILPLMSAEGDIQAGALWPLKITDEPIGADVYLLHAEVSALAPPEAAFVNIVQELIALYPDMT